MSVDFTSVFVIVCCWSFRRFFELHCTLDMCQLRGLLTLLPAPAQVSLTFSVALRRLRREPSRQGRVFAETTVVSLIGYNDHVAFEVMSMGTLM